MRPIRLKVEPTGDGYMGEVLDTEGILPTTPEEYSMGGRQGLYYRINQKGKRVNAHQGMEKVRGALFAAFFLALSVTAASIVLWPHPWVPVTAFILLAVFGGSLMAKDAQHGRMMFDAKQKVDEALIDPETLPTKEEVLELTALAREVAFPVQLREDMYQAVLDHVIDDHKITQAESYLLKCAHQILALSDVRIHELHRELISSAWLHALEEGHLHEEDFSWLGFVAEDLGLSPKEFEVELELVKEMQQTPPSSLPQALHPSPEMLEDDETLHAKEDADLFTPHMGVSESGWNIDLDGNVLVTSDRLILQGKHEKEIPLSSIREIELNVDTQQLVILQHGVHKPIHLSTEHPFQLGQILTAATQRITQPA